MWCAVSLRRLLHPPQHQVDVGNLGAAMHGVTWRVLSWGGVVLDRQRDASIEYNRKGR